MEDVSLSGIISINMGFRSSNGCLRVQGWQYWLFCSLSARSRGRETAFFSNVRLSALCRFGDLVRRSAVESKEEFPIRRRAVATLSSPSLV